MTAPLTHEEIQSLLGAFALDAVDRDEAEVVELHLRECPRCRAEVADHRATAGALSATTESAPLHLWDDLAASLDGTAPISAPRVQPFAPRVQPFAPRSRNRNLTWVAALAAASVLAFLGFRVTDQGRQIDRLQTELEEPGVLAAALAADRDPSAQRAELRSAEGLVLANVVLSPDGTGYLWGDGLPPVGPNRTYQLWAVVGGERISAGVFGPQPDVAPFQLAGDVVAFALTEEVAGGVVASTNPFVASGPVTTS